MQLTPTQAKTPNAFGRLGLSDAGEPRRTRTYNPLIKSQLLVWAFDGRTRLFLRPDAIRRKSTMTYTDTHGGH